MSRLTVVSLSEAQANLEVRHEVVVVREVGHELVMTIVVTYGVLVIVVVDKVHTNKKQ